jgi:hypothetical protein
MSLGFSQDLKVKHLKINNEFDHFTANVVGDKVFFSATLLNRRGRPERDKYDGFIFNIFEAKVNESGELVDPKPIEKTNLGNFNMSVTSFSEDGKFMYFTSNSVDIGENKFNDYKTYNLQLQRAEYVEGTGWTNFTVLPFCDRDYSYAHPALSPDGNTLYFVSNMEGSKGKTDIYKVAVRNHTSYGEPQLLSEAINSSRTEIFPYISPDNKLYFSSDRRGGVGGFDIYSFDLDATDKNQVPKVLPEPLNSIGEDFSFFVNKDLKSGYLTSRRYRGAGNDDLYYFTGF